MAREFDLVVMRTGAAAVSVASPCREAGWRVAVVDSRPFGGTCALRGCDPKKVLVGAANDQPVQAGDAERDAGGALRDMIYTYPTHGSNMLYMI